MKEILLQIRTKTLFYDIDYKTLLFLYQPILSPEATSLYLLMLNIFPYFFYNDKERYITYDLLLKILKVNAVDFLLLRKQLESVNLIKTYLNSEHVKHHCVVLYPPITPNSFFKHNFLCTKLRFAIGDEHLGFIQKLFRIKRPASSMGTNISASSETLKNLTVQLDSDHNHPNYDELLSRRKKKEIILGWEWLRTLNKKTLSIAWNKESINYFCNLRYIYNLSDELLSNLIINNLINNDELDLKSIKREANAIISKMLKKYVTADQPTTDNFQDKNLAEACGLMKSLSILEFYVYVYKEIPTKTILTSIMRVKQRHDIDFSIINCLLDFSYMKNKELVISYINKICETIISKNITSLEAVMRHLTNAYLSKRSSVRRSYFTDKNLFANVDD